MKKILLSIIVFLFISVLASPIVFAQSEATTPSATKKIITLSPNEVINKDYFAVGETVEIFGTVNGDVYIAGGQVFIDGKINGDLLVAGGMVNISGNITNDVRVAGGQITITGNIGKNLSLVGGNAEIIKGAVIGGNIAAAGGNLTLAAPVAGNVKTGAGNIVISNEIKGDLEVAGESIRLNPNTKVGGTLTYWSNNKAAIAEDVQIKGIIVHKLPTKDWQTKPLPSAQKAVKTAAGFWIYGKITSFVTTLLIGLLILFLFPKFAEKTLVNLAKAPWLSLGIGFISLLFIPILIILLLITIIGIPLALLVLFLFILLFYVARIFTIFWLGTIVFRQLGRKMREGWVFFAGMIVYYVITFVPVFGSLLGFLISLFGLGVVILTLKESSSSNKPASKPGPKAAVKAG